MWHEKRSRQRKKWAQQSGIFETSPHAQSRELHTHACMQHERKLTYVPLRSQNAPPSSPNPSGGIQHDFPPVEFVNSLLRATTHCFPYGWTWCCCSRWGDGNVACLRMSYLVCREKRYKKDLPCLHWSKRDDEQVKRCDRRTCMRTVLTQKSKGMGATHPWSVRVKPRKPVTVSVNVEPSL